MQILINKLLLFEFEDLNAISRGIGNLAELAVLQLGLENAAILIVHILAQIIDVNAFDRLQNVELVPHDAS
jgi:hypothetical protein